MNSLPETLRDHIVYTLNSRLDLIRQISGFQTNKVFKERIKCLMSFHEFKDGTAEPFLFALCYTIINKLRSVIMSTKTKTNL